jgi:hypothetical protein
MIIKDLTDAIREYADLFATGANTEQARNKINVVSNELEIPGYGSENWLGTLEEKALLLRYTVDFSNMPPARIIFGQIIKKEQDKIPRYWVSTENESFNGSRPNYPQFWDPALNSMWIASPAAAVCDMSTLTTSMTDYMDDIVSSGGQLLEHTPTGLTIDKAAGLGFLLKLKTDYNISDKERLEERCKAEYSTTYLKYFLPLFEEQSPQESDVQFFRIAYLKAMAASGSTVFLYNLTCPLDSTIPNQDKRQSIASLVIKDLTVQGLKIDDLFYSKTDNLKTYAKLALARADNLQN